MNHGKSLVVALTRFYGVVMLFYGVFYATYLGPFYNRYVTVFVLAPDHAGAARMFWMESLHVILRVLFGLVLLTKAEGIIDSLRPPEAEPGLRSLIVALVKLNGLILLFYSALNAIDLVRFFSNFPHLGWHAIFRGGPEMLRVCLDFLAGFLIMTCAGKIIGWLEPRPPGDAGGDRPATTIT